MGQLFTHKESQNFRFLFQKKGIDISISLDKSEPPSFHIWVLNEDDYSQALELFHFYRSHPDVIEKEFPYSLPPLPPPEKVDRFVPKKYKKRAFGVTRIFTYICCVVFMINTFQESRFFQKNEELSFLKYTPLEKSLFFDYPDALRQNPPNLENIWLGVRSLILDKTSLSTPMFEKIKEGEIWRLFTPCLLHNDLLHLVFNMLWFLSMGPQIEKRLPKYQFLLFILITAVVSNLGQYLVSGPFFLGFSGVVTAFAAFIWIRQKAVDQENYFVSQSSLSFLLIFILIMSAASFLLLFSDYLNISQLDLPIANTAHLLGACTGFLFGKLKSKKEGV
ncbi:MAG: rhomboid family intramembrane serine protease [Rhabdochlamydiaceae bacterium]